MRHQEVFRAYRELAAYFRGRRTEREARAALKIIKAFVRDREHMDPADRRPLGPSTTSKPTTRGGRKKRSQSEKVSRRRRRPAESRPAALPPPGSDEPSPPSDG
jgi:hypothetical protein